MPMPTRPVISGFHPDPSICRVGETYYLACSSFEYAPGVPIFRSQDLVTWTLVGHALSRPSQLRVADAAPSGGIYAPTLRHHDGRFWMITTNVSDGPGHLLVTADDPAGPWSEPVRIEGAGGIDPDIAWDDEGRCLITWCDAGLRQAELDPTTGALLTEPRLVWEGTGGAHVEGPHLYRVGDLWYLLAAEGGTAAGHMETIARGPSPSGPWEPCPTNPVLSARSTPAPVQSTGHADLVERPDGSWAMVFLAVRPRGYFPSWHVLGRETYAVEIEWRDGWPVPTTPIEPDEIAPAREHLGDELGGEWVGAHVFPDEVLRPAGDGTWLLTATAGGRAFVGRRQEHTRMVAHARLDANGGSGGLELRLDPTHAVTLEVSGSTVRAIARVGSLTSVLGEAPLDDDALLEIEVRRSPFGVFSYQRGPDEVVARVESAAGRRELGKLDGRYLSTEVAAGFTGRMVGLVAESGEVVVRSFEYRGHDDPDGL